MTLTNPNHDGHTYTYRWSTDVPQSTIVRTDENGVESYFSAHGSSSALRRFQADGGVCGDYVPPSE